MDISPSVDPHIARLKRQADRWKEEWQERVEELGRQRCAVRAAREAWQAAVAMYQEALRGAAKP